MKAGDFFRNGGRYLDRMDTLFDKALSRNGKENRFLTDIGIVEMAGFTVTRKNGKKYVTSPFQDFHDIKGNSSKENSAKMLLDAICREGLRGKNNIEFTCNYPSGKNISRSVSNTDIYLDLEDFVKTHEFGGNR